MKANPRKLTPVSSSVFHRAWLGTLSTATLLTACVPQPPAPAPRPAPVARPAPPAPPPPLTNQDWRDAAITPGDWRWTPMTSGSMAQFAEGQFTMRCDSVRHLVTLVRAAAGATTPRPVTITTTSTTRTLTATPVEGGLGITLTARDPLLDSMAFSRGRFAVEAPGTPALYIPSWTEVSRIIEDCR